MDDVLGKIVSFYNGVMAFEAYDIAHLLHPDRKYIERDDMIAVMQDFRTMDEIYVAHADALDFTLKIKAEMLREPILEAVAHAVEAAKEGDPSEVGRIIDGIGFMKLVSYPNDLRDIAREQVARYRNVLGDGIFPNVTAR